MRYVRHLGRWLVGALTLLLLVLAVGEATGWPMLRGALQSAIGRAAGVPVTMQGSFRARLLWRPGIETGQLRVGAGGGLPLPHLLDGRNVRIGWTWGDLWRWWRGAPLRLQSLSAGALDLQLVRTADGRASWQLGRDRAPRAQEGDDLPRIGTLTLADGRIRVDDAPLETRLQLAVEGGETAQGGGTAAGSGYRLAVQGQWRALPLKLQARTGGALPLLRDRADDAHEPALALQVQGEVGALRVAFDGRAAALVDSRQLDGMLELAAPSLARLGEVGRLTLPQTPPLQMRTRIRHDAGVWQLDGAQAGIGRSRLGGDFRYDTTTTPPRLTGRLAGPRLLLADLGPSIGTPPPAATTKAKAKGQRVRPAPPSPQRRVLPQRRFDLPSLTAMDADVQAAVDELDFGTDGLAALQAVRTRIRLQQGVLELQDLQARTAAGRISGSSRLEGEARPARWSAKLRLDGIDVARWLVVARDYVTGRLEADLDLAGAGRSTAEILATLDGRALVMVRDGTVSHLVTEAAGLDVAQALGVALRGDRRLPMRCARFDLRLRDGVVTPRTAVIDNRDSTLRIGGRVDLGDESLALALRARPKDFSPLALRAPVTLTGTLGAPRVGIEGGKAAGRLLGAFVLGAVVAPVAALLPLVDPGSGDAGDPCDPAPAAARAASAPPTPGAAQGGR